MKRGSYFWRTLEKVTDFICDDSNDLTIESLTMTVLKVKLIFKNIRKDTIHMLVLTISKRKKSKH